MAKPRPATSEEVEFVRKYIEISEGYGCGEERKKKEKRS